MATSTTHRIAALTPVALIGIPSVSRSGSLKLVELSACECLPGAPFVQTELIREASRSIFNGVDTALLTLPKEDVVRSETSTGQEVSKVLG